jgi:hypothetical protein
MIWEITEDKSDLHTSVTPKAKNGIKLLMTFNAT